MPGPGVDTMIGSLRGTSMRDADTFRICVRTTTAVVWFWAVNPAYTFSFFLSSGGQGKIKLKLTTLPRICVHVVRRFNSSTGHRLTLHWVAVHIQQ